MNYVLGGKGANLAEMCRIGLPVPGGFTITCQTCTDYTSAGDTWPEGALDEIADAVQDLEARMRKRLGDPTDPLLVSVRSGAPFSMPGMMDTVLNLGLTDASAQGLITQTADEHFVWDSYRRFIQMFSNVVMGIDADLFENALTEKRLMAGVRTDSELSASTLHELVEEFKQIFCSHVDPKAHPELVQEDRVVFPQDPKVQLKLAIEAVFGSWMNERASIYRKQHGISDSLGTAVNVQAMAYGNKGESSATGVAFTRNPATGEKKLFGEFLMNAQGEDVVAGVRTPQTIDQLAEVMPEAYKQFTDICAKLEYHYRDMQDMEFTIEDKKLYMLQTRNGKRTAAAAMKIACDLVDEGMITEEEAVAMIDPKSLDSLLHPTFDPAALKKAKVVGTGLAASPGAACGKIVFSAETATEWAKNGTKVVLVRLETSPEDIEGMHYAQGVLTVRGGMTSHAAVVARGMGTCCVSGCGAIKMNEEAKTFELSGKTYKEGDWISIDGSTGNIYGEKIKTAAATISGDFDRLMGWADKFRKLQVRTNADTPHDAQQAAAFGAEGIGLCRTEHMFFEADRIKAMREMIVSETSEQREKALAKLEPIQQADFEAIYEAMKGRPVTIRLLDPPLHEFVPTDPKDIEELAKEMGLTVEHLNQVISSLHEFNPMMGHRGCRLDVTFPEIAKMQTAAIIKAALAVRSRRPAWKITPEIMVPLVGEEKELAFVKSVIDKTAKKIIKEAGSDMTYKVGTMIEIPRAALTADAIANEAEFFSFGTNDLTQMTFGFSRDDAGKFLASYYDRKIYESDPFSKLDQAGVGRLVKMAAELGRQTRPDIKLGICGEQGGDPSTVEFCHKIGLTYVSCSPFRVPIARLAAAQAAIRNAGK